MKKKKPIPQIKKRYSKEWLTVGEWNRLSELKKSARDNVIIHLLYGCALRVSELCALQVKDVDVESSHLIIRKSKNEPEPRVIHIPSQVLEIIKPYVAEANPDESLIVCPTRPNSPHQIHRKTIYRIVRELAQKAGIKKPITTHTFRRSRATHLLDAGLRIERVSQLLRHKRFDTTRKYLKLAPEQLWKEMKGFDPLEKV